MDILNSDRMSKNKVDVRLKHPFTAMVVGATGSGKTVLLFNLILQAKSITSHPPVEIIYCYGVWQKAFEEVKGVQFHEGMIDVTKRIPNDNQPRWLIIDDLMSELTGKDSVNNLYTKFSHHLSISVFFVTQNLFAKGGRTQALNSKYFFLLKNPRDTVSITNLGKQAFSGRLKYFQEAYVDATITPYSYLYVDLSQTADERCRLIANYASLTKPMIVYTEK